MEKFKVSFEANDQQLKALSTKHASDTYADIEATFVLGNRWTDMDSVSAVWWNDFTRVATALDSQGKCTVPHEVLTRKGCVRVNLVGSIVEGDELITRLTSYSAEAVQVNEKIKLTGSETSEITPSQYEQFVANVKADADRAEAGATASAQSAQDASESATASANSASESAQSAQNASESAQNAETAKEGAEDARDEIRSMRATAETLEAGSDATASYSDGLLTLGIPRGDKGVKGDTGETGATPNFSIGEVDTLEPNESATATITGTAENPVLNLGIPKGDTGEVSLEDLEALLPTETASGEIVTITDGQSIVPAKSLSVTLEPIQEGSGTPSPTNIRPISGHTSVDTIVSPTTEAEDGTTYTTSLGQTVYGGTLDVVSGELVVDRAMADLGSLAWNFSPSTQTMYSNVSSWSQPIKNNTDADVVANILCENYAPDTGARVYSRAEDGIISYLNHPGYGGNLLRIYDSNYTDSTAFKQALSGVMLCYELATPQTIQLTPQEVELLTGTNNVWSDGNVTLVYSADIQRWVEKKLS